MKIGDTFDYRNSEAILKKNHKDIFDEMIGILDNKKNKLKLEKTKGEKQRNVSKQIQTFFENKGWNVEKPTFTVPDLIYDAVKEDVAIEIEISYQRQVYADFFKFLMDFSNDKINAGILIVTHDPTKFGHSWHASLESTKRKLLQIKNNYLVPVYVIGIDP
jgi:hypothetical protein